MPEMPDEFRSQGTGSGVIVEVEGQYGYILTNNHVAGGATDITVELADGRVITGAQVMGTDPKSDLAVVRIEADNLIPAQLGDSDQLDKGDWVLAFGSPFGYVGSMTSGIISAKNRQTGILGQLGQENFIQTDAAINPGNSGGPLVNLRGEVIGINTAIASRTGGFNGIGFAIPSNQAKPIYEILKQGGKVERGYLGVGISDLTDPRGREQAEVLGFEGTKGVLVGQVTRDAPAAGALRPGDIITAINGAAVDNVSQLRQRVANTPPNTKIDLTVFRAGKTETVSVTLGAQPDDLESVASVASPNQQDTTVGLGLRALTDEVKAELGIDNIDAGVAVTEVTTGSPAARAGLQPGDVITSIDGKPVTTLREASDAIKAGDLNKGIRMIVANQQGQRFVVVRRAR